MHTKLKNTGRYLLMAAVGWLSLCPAGCPKEPLNDFAAKSQQKVTSDRPISEFRVQLLDVGFQTASAIPVYPHVKDRSRAQAAVVDACLKLDQPVRARRLCGQIDQANMHRGLAYGQLANYCIARDCVDEAKQHLVCLKEVIGNIEQKLAPDEISWRRDALQSLAEQISGKIDKKEQTENKGQADSDTIFNGQVQALDAAVESGNFETIKGSLYSLIDLFDELYGNAERRLQIRSKVTASSNPMPIVIRLDVLMKMAQVSLDHADQNTALTLVNECRQFLDDYQWDMEDYIPRAAQVAQLRYQAGDTEKARQQIDTVHELYDARGQEIMSTFRFGALLPLAPAYAAMGDTETALKVYKRAIEQGAENPNARPRALDLSAACCSMAASGIEPDKALWERMDQITNGLADPW